jgi:hypothetical protein
VSGIKRTKKIHVATTIFCFNLFGLLGLEMTKKMYRIIDRKAEEEKKSNSAYKTALSSSPSSR